MEEGFTEQDYKDIANFLEHVSNQVYLGGGSPIRVEHKTKRFNMAFFLDGHTEGK